jgi:hypothetical protein
LCNDSGFRGSIQGRSALHDARRKAIRAPDPPPASVVELAAQFSRPGVLRFDDAAPPELVTGVSDSFDDLIRIDEACDDRAPLPHRWVHRYLRDAHLQIPDLPRLLTEEVARVIEATYGCPFRVRSVRAYRNTGLAGLDPSVELYANHWHLDPEVTCDLRYFVYLSDATVDSGALETIDRPSTRLVLRSGYIDRNHVLGRSRRLLGERSVVHDGARGTGILLDAQRVLHRAGTCLPGRHRDIVQFWIAPSPVPLPADWGERLGPDPSFRGGRPGDG